MVTVDLLASKHCRQGLTLPAGDSHLLPSLFISVSNDMTFEHKIHFIDLSALSSKLTHYFTDNFASIFTCCSKREINLEFWFRRNIQFANACESLDSMGENNHCEMIEFN